VNGEIQVQKVLCKVKEEGDPILILKIINLYIKQLEKQEEKLRKAKKVELELTLRGQESQLKVIGASAEQLNKALDEGVLMGISAAYKDLVSRVRSSRWG
jgi:hypothetical protein